MSYLDGFEDLTEANRLPDGMIGAKAAISQEDNEFAKREARAHGKTALVYLGELLSAAIQEARQESKSERIKQVEEMLGPNWKELMKELM